MILKLILRQLLPGAYVLLFSAFLLGLACYSYRARELLVCWLFLCSLFAVPAVVFLSAVLAWYAGKKLVEFSRVVKTLVPKLALWFVQLLQETVSGPRIIVAVALKPPMGHPAAVSLLDPHSRLLVEVVPALEGRVQK